MGQGTPETSTPELVEMYTQARGGQWDRVPLGLEHQN
jgi:hypothetical protein